MKRPVTKEPRRDAPKRIAAALVAAFAWAGLLVQFQETHHAYSATATLWILLAYFTILTNLLVAIVFTGQALGSARCGSPRLVAGTTLAIVLVGAVTALLLRNALELSGGSILADRLLHRCTPVLVPLFWLAYTPKGHLRGKDPLLWASFPLLYLAYALLRGAATGRYAYPFLNVAQLGWPRTMGNAVAIAVAFLLVAYGFVWLDGRLVRRPAA